MVMSVLVQRLKASLVFLINIIKRSISCFRRRRKSSVPLTAIAIVPNIDHHNIQDASWNDWDEEGSRGCTADNGERQGSDRNQHYTTKQQPQPQHDFFQDMEPEIKRQKIIKLKAEGRGRRKDEDPDSGGALDNAAAAARLACHDHRFTSPEELGSWEEGNRVGEEWSDAELGWDVVLRHQRNIERHQRRSNTRSTLAAKLVVQQPS